MIKRGYSPRLGGARGFTMIEVITVLVFVGILAGMSYSVMRNTRTSYSGGDIEVIKMALRELQLRSMANLATANLNATATSSSIILYDNGASFASYQLSGTTSDFSVAFDQLGRVKASNNLPGAISIESETGYIP